MNIIGKELLNANSYDRMLVRSNEVVVESDKPFDVNNFCQIGENFVDDNFMSLSDRKQVEKLVDNHFLFSTICGVENDEDANLSFLTSGRKLIFEDRSYSDIEEKLLSKFNAAREYFLLDCLEDTDRYCFFGDDGCTSYETYTAGGLKVAEFVFPYEFDEDKDLIYSNGVLLDFCHILEMIAGDKCLEVTTNYKLDDNGEPQVVSLDIEGADSAIVVDANLDYVARKAVSIHNNKNERIAKKQMKMEGF